MVKRFIKNYAHSSSVFSRSAQLIHSPDGRLLSVNDVDGDAILRVDIDAQSAPEDSADSKSCSNKLSKTQKIKCKLRVPDVAERVQGPF